MSAKASVVGTPLGHTLSPEIFRIFSESMDTPLDYTPQELNADELPGAFSRAKQAGVLGWNITLPHKIGILELADEIDPSAKTIGAANVIRFGKTTTAFNTDAAGFLAPLRRLYPDSPSGRAVIFGAGGAARAVGAALRASNAKDLLFVNRTLENAERLARDFDGRAMTPQDPRLAQSLKAAGLVVNATSLGLDGRANPLPQNEFPNTGALAYDLVYRPAQTPFLTTAKNAGARTLGGLAMLVAQAAETWEIWFGQAIPARIIERVETYLTEKI